MNGEKQGKALGSGLIQDYRVTINVGTALLDRGEVWDYSEKFGVAKFIRSQRREGDFRQEGKMLRRYFVENFEFFFS